MDDKPRWEHEPYDPRGADGVALLIGVILLLASAGVLFWLLDRTAP